jgi:hypothetical protein
MLLSRPRRCPGFDGLDTLAQVSLDEPDIYLSRNDRTVQQNVSPSDLFEAVFILEANRVPIKAVRFISRSSE